jgi:hypothetical protein
MATGSCHGLASDGGLCRDPDLCDAHIFPRSFARDIMRGHTQAKRLSLRAVTSTQHGVYDSDILCATCDRKLGVYDKYAVEVCRRAASTQAVLKTDVDLALSKLASIPDVDGDRLALFVLALMWRASISKRWEFRKVDLGDYCQPVREVLFGHCSLDSLRGFQTYVERFQTKRRISPNGFYTSPYRVLTPERNAWAFALRGFRFTVKFDPRPFNDEVKPFIINGSTSLLCPLVSIEGGPEDAAFVDILSAHHERRAIHGATQVRIRP